MKLGDTHPWLGVVAGVAGGVVGHFLFLWIARQGLYAMVLPGAFVGLGYRLAVAKRHLPAMMACGVLGLWAGVFSEWRLAPFLADSSWAYFLSHVHQLRGLTLISIGLGAALAVYLARGRAGTALSRDYPDK